MSQLAMIEARMSAADFGRLAEGADALRALGRGPEVLESYLEAMPEVAERCGAETIAPVVSALAKLSPLTSASVLVQFFVALPTAARHLEDSSLLAEYLGVVHHLASTAPRGLRPVLTNLDELLSKLSVHGLRRWIDFGAREYRHDYANLVGYFELQGADSRAVLEQERPGTLFSSSRRHLLAYVRALWGREFQLRPYAARHEPNGGGHVGATTDRPRLVGGVLYVPDAVASTQHSPGIHHYRAIVAHLASHLTYGVAQPTVADLDPLRRLFVGLVEDARIERLAIQEMPGLLGLWLTQLRTQPRNAGQPDLVDQTFHVLLDPSAKVTNRRLRRFAEGFHTALARGDAHTLFARDKGLELLRTFEASGPLPSLRSLERSFPAYRDDNRSVWQVHDEGQTRFDVDVQSPAASQVRYDVSPLMMAHTLDCELAGDDAQEIWTCTDRMRVYEDDLSATATTFNDLIGRTESAEPVEYDEWDYQVQRYRPDWVRVLDKRPHRGDAERCDRVLQDHKPVTRVIERIIDELSPAGMQRHRGLEDGDAVDLPAAIDAMIALRSGQRPNARVMTRTVLSRRELAVVLLLDLSESTNTTAAGSSKTILEITFEAAVLLAVAIEGIGDPFAIHGFASDGRHNVEYRRFKNFDQHLDPSAKACLSAMTGGLSTRMGAGLRHAGHHLADRPEQRRLVLLLTDGEPADVDEPDPKHLREDTKKAVEELRAEGVSVHCLTIDSEADRYAGDLFGHGHFTVIDRVERLPEQLPKLFGLLTT